MVSEVDDERKTLVVNKGNINIVVHVGKEVYGMLENIDRNNNGLTATNTASGVLKPFKMI